LAGDSAALSRVALFPGRRLAKDVFESVIYRSVRENERVGFLARGRTATRRASAIRFGFP